MTTTTQGRDRHTSVFAEGIVQVDAARIRYLEAGQGAAVVVLREDTSLTPSLFDTLLAQTFRVIVVGMPRTDETASRAAARTLTHLVAALAVEHYMLVSTAAHAHSALWQVLETPEQFNGLVLLSPPALHTEGRTNTGSDTHDAALESRLPEIQAPTLVVFGTNAQSLPADAGQRYVERLTSCYYTLLYDAGQDIATDRPHALFAAVRDFVERRGAFIVEQASTALNP
ncbi:MAG: hypothetical protein HYZ50_19915 [Deltaproteobacteria bacterium]|nr:hypothetical protein [Deltaproteobacteria bacterium]